MGSADELLPVVLLILGLLGRDLARLYGCAAIAQRPYVVDEPLAALAVWTIVVFRERVQEVVLSGLGW